MKYHQLNSNVPKTRKNGTTGVIEDIEEPVEEIPETQSNSGLSDRAIYLLNMAERYNTDTEEVKKLFEANVNQGKIKQEEYDYIKEEYLN